MKAGRGTLICEKCGGPKKMLESKVCGKPACRTHGWRQVGHKIVRLNRAKRGEVMRPTVPCPYCGAEVEVPEEGEIKCPRCKAVIE